MRQILSILLMAVLASSPALARPLYRLPAGTRLQVDQGTFQGYTLEEMKVLLKMDVDLEFYEKEIPRYKQSLEDFKKIVEAKDSILKSKDVQIDILKKEQTRITDKWSQENKLRLECENAPKFGSWVSWTIAAVMTATAIALGVTLAVRESK